MKARTTLLSIFVAVLALMSSQAFAQGQIVYSAYDGSQELSGWGTSKQEHFDVAIHIADPALVGKQISALRIPFKDTTNLTNGTLFLTKELAVENNVNVADVASQSFSIAEGFVEVALNTPYTITEEGIYVGYSFDMTGDNNAPVTVVTNSNANKENFYVHADRTYRKWASKAKTYNMESALQVVIDGVAMNAAAITGTDIDAQMGVETETKFTVTNIGTEPVRKVEFSYTLDGTTYTGSRLLGNPLEKYGDNITFPFTIPSIADAGTYEMILKIDKVNDEENGNIIPDTLTLTVYPVYVVHRPLIEEYTGTTCGWCPKGLVSMDKMDELLGEDFVGVSYHTYDMSDPMYYNGTDPNDVTSFPNAWLDRYHNTDPYSGDFNYYFFGMDKTYAAYSKVEAPARLDVDAYYYSSGTIETRTVVTFPLDKDETEYKLSYILTADGLTGSTTSWKQSNYFAGQGDTWQGEDLKYFTNGSSRMEWTYNDVVVDADEEVSTLPAEMKAGEPWLDTHKFYISGNKLIQHKDQVHVVVALIDKSTFHVVNAFKAKVKEASAIRDINGPVSTDMRPTVYNLSGKRLSQPQKGVNIVRMGNGKTFKVMK